MRARLTACTWLVVVTGASCLTMGIQSGDSESGPMTLRQAAGHQFLIGAAVRSSQLNDPRIVRLLPAQFDSLTAEIEFMPQLLQPDDGRFTFEGADRIVAFAHQHHMSITGHMLCWNQVTGQWMFEDADHHPLPRDVALAHLKSHIDTVMSHFKGKMASWDVVNEAISDKPGEYLRDTPARRAIGDDYVEKAFEFAHAADPDVPLYYNDYNDEDPQKLPKTIRLIRSLKARGLRIDAVGMQGHWLIDYPAPSVIDAALDAYAKEGLKVMITELDIDVLPRAPVADLNAVQKDGANPYKDGLPPEVLEREARRYGEIFAVFKKHPGLITLVNFWGVDDGQSWLNDFPVKGRMNYPLLFDRHFEPKPALKAVLDVLSEQ